VRGDPYAPRNVGTVIFPRLRSLGRKVPTKAIDLIDPIVSLYAANLCKDWGAIYFYSLQITETILGVPVFKSARYLNISDLVTTWVATPIRRSGETAKAYAVLKRVLTASVDWLTENEPHFAREICRYVSIFDGLSFIPPSETLQVPAGQLGERDWVIYRWNNGTLNLAALKGDHPTLKVIPSDNFPDGLHRQAFTAESLFLRFMMPGGTFPRYEVWFPQKKLRGVEQETWFSLNYLGTALARSAVDRRRIQRHMPLSSQQIAPEKMERWRLDMARALGDLELGKAEVRLEEIVGKGDWIGYFKHHFPHSPEE
jgi:hypothetical protein